MYEYALRGAKWIVAQTERQRLCLRQAVNLESEVVPMAINPPVTGQEIAPVTSQPTRILWIGRITPSKRFEWLLEAARHSPNLRFDVAGTPNRRSEYAMRLQDEASQLSNVRVHGRVSEGQLASLYREAAILCCTSELEGFPTTFLEAWSCGIPIVTTFDPDQLVAHHGLGRVVRTVDELIFNLHDLAKDADAYGGVSRAAVEYFAQNHAPERVAQCFRSLLERVVQA
jgi:glycosyltransferase involved in cell wall biosynthesis